MLLNMLQGNNSMCDINAVFSSSVKELFFHHRFATVGVLCERSDLKCSNPTLNLTIVIEQKGIGAVVMVWKPFDGLVGYSVFGNLIQAELMASE